MWSGNVKTATRSLRMAKWRSIFTMIGIIIGVSSVITVVSLGEGLKQQIVGQIDKLGSDVLTIRSGKLLNGDSGTGTNSINILALLNTSTLSDEDITMLEELKSVNGVAPLNFLTSTVKKDSQELNNVFVIGTSPDFYKMVRQTISYGEFFNEDGPTQNYAVIGPTIAHKLFGMLNPVGQTLEVKDKEFIVRGVLAPSSGGLVSVAQTDFNTSVFLPYTATKDLAKGQTNILQILVKAKDAKELDPTIGDINKTLLASHDDQNDFTVLKQFELLGIASDVVNKFTGFITAVAAISLLVGGIGIMAIMLVSVSERTREIGIRKALGATNRQIMNQFLVEGIVISVGGGIIGIILSLIIFFILKVYTNLQPALTLPIILLAVVISLAVGIIFSVAPAYKAARKNPIDALRGE